MASLQDIDAQLQELLDCVAQTHRRALRAQSEADAARQEAAATKSAAASGTAIRSIASRLLSSFRRGFKEGAESRDASEPVPELAAATARPAAISFHGRMKIGIPLTLDSQTVRLPSSPTPRELWLTTVGAARPVRSVVSIRVMADESGCGDGSVPGNDVVQVMAGRPHRLFSLGAETPALELEIRRTEGTFCVLVLELCDRGSRRSAEIGAAALGPMNAARDAVGEGRGIGIGPIIGLEENAKHSAGQLDQKLWGGFERYALAELEHLKYDPYAAPKERVAAAWYLTRWHYVSQDYAGALANIEFAKALPIPLTPRVVLAETQCLINLGRDEEALELLRSQPDRGRGLDYRLLESTAARHVCLSEGASLDDAEARQLALINDVLMDSGLAPLHKKHAGEPLSLANLAASAEPGDIEQVEKVSVIVPAFNAEATIGWVIDSLLAQTWRKLEIIVVDDASSDRTAAIVESIAERDARVRLIRLDENGGSYPARNAGARQATGDLIMVHDSDDWSHPQQIEMQVRALDKYPHARGVKSHWVRVSEHLEALSTWIPRGSILELDFSSFLFRREVLDELGFWDDVRVSGDAEFILRFRAVYGDESIVKIPRNYLLALSLTRHDSLTRSPATHLRSLHYGLRRSYRDAYCWWHGRIARDTELPFDSQREPRAFPVPLGNQPRRQAHARFDVVVIADFAAPGRALESALGYCAAAGRMDRRAAVFHWRHYDLTTRAPLLPAFYQACVQHDLSILNPGDSVTARVVLVADPTVLEHMIDPRPEIDAERVVVTVEHGAGPDAATSLERFDPVTARIHLERIFGTEGLWVAASAETAGRMRDDPDFPAPAATSWRPIVDTDVLSKSMPRWRGGAKRTPVVGRRIVGELDWPSNVETFEQAYGAGQACRTRFLGGSEALRRLMPELPQNWQLVEDDNVDAVEFCRGLDCYLHYPHELRAGEISRGVLEAMALGVPVVAPPRLAETFGDAIACASPREAMEVVGRLWSSEEEYLRLAERARAFVLERHGPASFFDALVTLTGERSLGEPRVDETAVRSRCA